MLLSSLHSPISNLWPLLPGLVLVIIAVWALVRAGWSRAAIVIATLAVLYPLCGSNFSWWDDQLTIHQNPRINTPSFESVAYYWTSFKDGLYVPVTYTVWGALAKIAYVGDPGEDGIFLNPWFFHSTSVGLHLVCSVLVFGVLQRLVNRTDAACIGALLFGVHPVQVETIGWVSGMKDLLCWTFSLSIVLLYVRRIQEIQRNPTPAWASRELPICCLLLVLGILSKPTAMVTPAALLVVDAFLLRKQWLRPLRDLAPLFVISGIGAVIARLAQNVEIIEPAPLWQRPFIVCDNVVFYFGKIFWPARLGIDYSRTLDALTASPLIYVKWIIPLALAVLAFQWRKRRPLLLVGLAIFFIGFAPVSGLATFQMQGISFTTDHYLYFSMLGISLVAAWIVSILPRRIAYTGGVILLSVLAVRSHVQTAVWYDNEALFAGTIKANPNSAVARNNLAAMYMQSLRPRLALAEPLLEEAVRLRPELAHSRANLGRVKAGLGKNEEAIVQLHAAWKIMIQSGAGNVDRANLARAIAEQMERMDRIDEAIEWAQRSEENIPNEHTTRQLMARLKWKATTRPSTQPATTHPAPVGGSASDQ